MPLMNPISSAELTALQAEVPAAACDTACIVKRQTKTADGYGGNTVSYSTIETTLVGLRQPTAKEAQAYDYLIGDQAAWMVKFPTTTLTQSGDHLFIGSQVMVAQANLSLQSYSFLSMFLAVEIQ